MKTYSIVIPEGTKVGCVKDLGSFGKKSVLIELLGNVYIDNAVREEDGCYSYKIGNSQYYCSAGTVNVMN